MSKLVLRDGPLRGLNVRAEGAEPITIAFQMIAGKKRVVSTPFSSVAGEPPAAGVEIVVCGYDGNGEYQGEGSGPRAT